MMNIEYKVIFMVERTNILLRKSKQRLLLKKGSQLKNLINESLLKTFIKDKMGPTSRYECQLYKLIKDISTRH